MGDASKFETLMEYHLMQGALDFLIFSEIAILIFSMIGKTRGTAKHDGDRGTVWLIMIGWLVSFMAGSFFRSQAVPVPVRAWLLPHAFYAIGVSLIFLGVIFRCWAVGTLKKAFTHSVQTTEEQHLIQRGLYRIVRNPAYTGSILSLLGVAFAYRQVFAPFFVLAVCFLCYGIRIRVEEKALSAWFGEEFQQYCRSVRFRLFPGLY